ncbi:MAG: hypothetical protein ACRD8Z_10905 [Nitrososphaeraceae archaeon]
MPNHNEPNQKKTMIRWKCVYCNQIVEGKDYLTESAVPSLNVMTKLPKPSPNIWGTPVGMR